MQLIAQFGALFDDRCPDEAPGVTRTPFGFHANGQARFWLTGGLEVVSAVMASVWSNGILKVLSGTDWRGPLLDRTHSGNTFKPGPPEPASERKR
ncbi:MAG: hypothetical protein QOK02_242 [Mycobacterium sp.]|jgi:hypothetical protein|nr:hypothetical protein [Mycobacterium sp.]